MCIIAHVDHGKTTLADSLVARAGKLATARAGDACVLDGGTQEKARGITITASAVTLDFARVPGVVGRPAERPRRRKQLSDEGRKLLVRHYSDETYHDDGVD